MTTADHAPRLNRLAVVAFASSVLTLFGVGSLLGVGLAVVALNQISVHGGRGRALAYAAIVVGALTLLATMIVIGKAANTW